MRPRIKLIYVLAIAFVIAAGGVMAINRLNGEIADLEDKVTQGRLDKAAVNAEGSEMEAELSDVDSDSYIRNKARTLYHYLSQGEILFVVENPEALYEEGEMPQEDTAGDTAEDTTEDTTEDTAEDTQG